MKNLSTLILSLFFLGNIYGQGCWKEISAGVSHTLAIKNDGTLWAWGRNLKGQLGDGTVIDKNYPIQIGVSNDWKYITTGYGHSIATKNDGTLWAWGDNANGQLGDGTFVSKNIPIQIGNSTNWRTIAAGIYHTLAIKNDGTLWTWGYNNYGQLGDGTTIDKNSPIQIGALNDWKYIIGGNNQSAAIKDDGSLWSWGWNYYGQLGDGTTINKTSPVKIGISTSWDKVFFGSAHTIALKFDGTIWAWGSNTQGQLGDGTFVNKYNPNKIGLASNWKSISAGNSHNIAIKTDSSIWSWGWNFSGQLGDGTNINKNSPIQIGGVNKWNSIFSNCIASRSISIQFDSTLWAWGSNSFGELGDGTNTNKSTPTLIQCPTTPNPTGLIGYYPFNGNANDESGSNNNGTVQGASLTLDRFGNRGKAYSFNGTNSYIDLGTNINPAVFTISAWAKFDNITNLPAIVSKITNVNGSYFKNFELGFLDNNGTPRCIVPNGSTWTQVGGSTSLGDNKWNHILATYDGTTAKLYINGILNQSASMAYTSSTSSTYIGARPLNDQQTGSPKTDLYFNGKLDDIRIYNRALNVTEVSDIYNAEKPPVTQSLPYITLSSTSLSVGQNLTITGKDFSPNYSDTLNIYSYQAKSNFKIPFTTNSLGIFSQTLGINASNKGKHIVSARDTIKNQPITSQMYEVKDSNSVISTKGFLTIYSPDNSEIIYNTSDNKLITLMWRDKIYDKAKLIPNTSISIKNYKIEYRFNGGAWIQALSQAYQTRGIFSEMVSFNHEYKFTQDGDYQFKISENDNTDNWDTSYVFKVLTPQPKNMDISFEWDWNGNRPEKAPFAICADGTSRLYIKLTRKQFNEQKISSISVTLKDRNNLVIDDVKFLGKVAYTKNLNKYDLSGNNAQYSYTFIDNLNDDKKSDYYFWYIAPEEFVRNLTDEDKGSRTVDVEIKIDYYGGTASEVHSKPIKIFRPPLMLVHGWNGSKETTWKEFGFKRNNIFYKYEEDKSIFLAGVFVSQMHKNSKFLNNGYFLVGQDFVSLYSIPNTLRKVREQGICATKVDYICHSMGGCMIRAAINGWPQYYTPAENSGLDFKNYGKGFTNKIITINTPHNGSTGADLLVNLYNTADNITKNFVLNLQATNMALDLLNLPKINLKIIPDALTPSDAVYNMQYSNPNPDFGGIRFKTTKNVKCALIGSQDPGLSETISVHTLQNLKDLDFNLTKILIMGADALAYSSGHKYLSPSKYLGYLNNAMWLFGADNFFPNSDGVVPLPSQFAIDKNSSLSTNHFLIKSNIVNSFHSSITNGNLAGDIVYDLLNEHKSSYKFSDTFPPNPKLGTGIALGDEHFLSKDSIIERNSDTSKFIFEFFGSHNNYIDSTIAVRLTIKDTNNLIANKILVQDNLYINPLYKGVKLFLFKINSHLLDSQNIYQTLSYDSSGYRINYNISIPIKVIPFQSPKNIYSEVKLKYLYSKEEFHPNIFADFDNYIARLNLFNTDISLIIADTNVMRYNGYNLVANDTGTTYVVINYRGLRDTTYYVITPPIEIVHEACVPPTVDFSYTLSGKMITLTNKSTNATNYKWKLSNGDVLTTTNPTYTFTDTGEYLVCLTSYNACDSTKICQTVKISGNNPDSFDIVATVNPSGAGAISGQGRFPANQSRTLIATANAGFEFTDWTENGNQVSSTASYTFNLDKNRNLTANFKSTGAGVSNSFADNIKIYPNPTNAILNIDLLKNDLTTIRIENLLGQIILKKQISSLKSQIDISTIPKGVYIIELIKENGEAISKKLMIE